MKAQRQAVPVAAAARGQTPQEPARATRATAAALGLTRLLFTAAAAAAEPQRSGRTALEPRLEVAALELRPQSLGQAFTAQAAAAGAVTALPRREARQQRQVALGAVAMVAFTTWMLEPVNLALETRAVAAGVVRPLLEQTQQT